MIHQCVVVAAFLILFALLGALALLAKDEPVPNKAPMPTVAAPATP
jgi:hypothetical protein